MQTSIDCESKNYFKKYKVGKCQVQGGVGNVSSFKINIKYSPCAKKTIKSKIEFWFLKILKSS